MPKLRLDQAVVTRRLVVSRSQAESYIKLGKVLVNGKAETKPGFVIHEVDEIKLNAFEQYVSRAALKLASVAEALAVDFKGKTVLDVGSSTGGFTEYALRHGAKKVLAVEVGTDQMHPSLRGDARIELHEKTDIRDFRTEENIDLVVADVSFISLRDILPYIRELVSPKTEIIAMAKPQFEAVSTNLKHKGVIKNDHVRRDILKDFEIWASQYFVVGVKTDSLVAGAKGNLERFYKLRKK